MVTLKEKNNKEKERKRKKERKEKRKNFFEKMQGKDTRKETTLKEKTRLAGGRFFFSSFLPSFCLSFVHSFFSFSSFLSSSSSFPGIFFFFFFSFFLFPKVVDGVHALGRAAQANKFSGPVIGAKPSEKAERNFSEDVLNAGNAVIGGQAGQFKKKNKKKKKKKKERKN